MVDTRVVEPEDYVKLSNLLYPLLSCECTTGTPNHLVINLEDENGVEAWQNW